LHHFSDPATQDWETQKKQNEKFTEKAGGNPDAYIASLRERVHELQAALAAAKQ
jgi:hypothetical protein